VRERRKLRKRADGLGIYIFEEEKKVGGYEK
jgi:hypothetical protein